MITIGDRPLVSTVNDRYSIEDDTEESVPGSDYHLAAILALYEVLLRFAQRMAKRWYVTAEVVVLVEVPDRPRNPWGPMPNVYVVLDTEQTPRTSLDTRAGASFPRFIREVASKDTWRKDVGKKQRVYGDLGTLEYIVFDPTEQFLREPFRAWHRRPDGSWDRWEPDADGFLTSTVLGLRFRAENRLLRVYDPDSSRLPIGRELEAQVAEIEQAAHAQAAELEWERARNKELEARLAALEAERRPEG